VTRVLVWGTTPIILLGGAILADQDAGRQAAWAAARARFFAGARS
jgi:hypothetical protein